MSIVLTEDELETYLKKATDLNHEHPVVIRKFITDAREIEIDAVADHGELFCYAITEHVENAGVHSGDATIVLPPQRTYLETMRRVKNITRKIASEFEITGPFNIQFIAKDNDVKVIECNLRASRSFPFVSKTLKINFIDIATKLMLGEKVARIDKSIVLEASWRSMPDYPCNLPQPLFRKRERIPPFSKRREGGITYFHHVFL